MGSAFVSVMNKKTVRQFENRPRDMSVLPVLIHVNGVTESVFEEEYFYAIIDFRELLE